MYNVTEHRGRERGRDVCVCENDKTALLWSVKSILWTTWVRNLSTGQWHHMWVTKLSSTLESYVGHKFCFQILGFQHLDPIIFYMNEMDKYHVIPCAICLHKQRKLIAWIVDWVYMWHIVIVMIQLNFFFRHNICSTLHVTEKQHTTDISPLKRTSI